MTNHLTTLFRAKVRSINEQERHAARKRNLAKLIEEFARRGK